ncbi:MATE family efflux transporter [Clostridium sp. JS66]|uniref:MATE family efflux transporter n=1 Tax=Clostridium sp. JS66 TaxID=3064705 RepID=UPI00399AC708
MTNNNLLGTESIGKLLLKFSLPAIVGMMVNGLYNVVDRFFIGKLGALAMTGIGINFPFMTLIMAFSSLVGVGAAATISIRLGENRKSDAEKTLGNAFALLAIIMILVSIIGLSFKTHLLYLFGASEATIGYASEYITIILCGTVFQGIGLGLNNVINAEGNPRKAMFTMLIGAIINIILNPILVFSLNMGVSGSALATVISQFVSSIWVISHFIVGKSNLKLKRENLKLNLQIINGIISIGMTPFFAQIAATIEAIISNSALRTNGGDIAISAMTVINSIIILLFMPLMGITQGAQPILGFNYGAKQFKRVKETLKVAIIAATTLCIITFSLTQIFPVILIKIFNKDPELIRIASHGLRVFLLMTPIIGVQIVSSNYFQAIGKAKSALILSMLRQVIILIPMLLILPNFFGLEGVWMAGPIADFMASVITAILLYKEMRLLAITEP